MKLIFQSLILFFSAEVPTGEQAIVCRNLLEIQKEFKKNMLVRDNGVVIAVCGGYQLLGKYYKTDSGLIEGLNLVDIYTEQERRAD